MRIRLITLFLLFSFPAVSLCQDRGTVFGKVETMERAALRNTLVKLESDSLFAGFLVTQTDQKGSFKFNNLPSGNYKLSLKKDGYRNLDIDSFLLNHGASRKLSLVMVSSHLQEVISLSQKAGDIDTTESSDRHHLDYQYLSNYSNLRKLLNSVSRIPGFNDFSGYGSVSQSGAVVKINGVPVMDPGKGLLAAELSQELISEITLDMFGAEASTNTNMGPSINIITKSGAKSLRGEASLFIQTLDWTGDNTSAYKDQGLRVPVPSAFSNPALALGGPAIDSRMWFFGGVSYFKRHTDRPIKEGILDVNKTSTQYNIAVNGKINDSHKAGFSLFSNSDDISHQPWKDIWLDNYEASLHKKDSYFDLYHFDHLFEVNDSISLTNFISVFNNGLFLKPIVEGEIKYDQAIGSFLPDTGNSHSRSEEGYRETLGTNLNYFSDSFLGRHNIDIGLEYERRVFERVNDQQALSFYWNEEKYKLFDFGRIEAKSRLRRFSAYFQDSINVNPRLTLNFGLRVDSTNHTSVYPDTSPSGSDDFLNYSDLSYRVGFAYDAFGDGKTIVKGNAGRFYKTPLVGNTEPFFLYYPDTRLYYGEAILGSAIGDNWVLWNEYNNHLPLKVDDNLGNEYTEGFYFGVDQQIDDVYSASMDFVWKKDNNIIGITYPEISFSTSVTDYEGQNGSYEGIYYNILSKGSYALYTNPKEGDPGVAAPLYRKYYALTASFIRSLNQGIAFSASYTFSRNEGTVDNASANILYGQDYFGDPNYFINRDGRLGLERPHAIKITGMAVFPEDIAVSAYFRYLSGTPFAPEVTLGANNFLAEVNDGSMRLDDQFLLDIRLSKSFTLMDRYQVTLISDLFNALNNDAITSYVSRNIDSPNFMKPGSIVNARFFQLGMRLTF